MRSMPFHAALPLAATLALLGCGGGGGDGSGNAGPTPSPSPSPAPEATPPGTVTPPPVPAGHHFDDATLCRLQIARSSRDNIVALLGGPHHETRPSADLLRMHYAEGTNGEHALWFEVERGVLQRATRLGSQLPDCLMTPVPATMPPAPAGFPTPPPAAPRR